MPAPAPEAPKKESNSRLQPGMTARASWPSPSGAAMIVRVVVPLSTVWVPRSPTEERMPGSARPARCRVVVSIALRGLGPPNRASSASCAAVPSAGRGAPGCGGTSSKSGGITSGAWRCTANSSGRSRLSTPPLPQAASSMAPEATRTIWVALRIRGILRGWVRLLLPLRGGRFLAHEQRAGKDYQHADGDRGIGHVEHQEGPERADVEVGIVDHVAVEITVLDIPERAAEDQREPRDVPHRPLAQQPHEHDQRDQAGHRDQRPAHLGRRRLEHAERDAEVLRPAQIEERQQVDHPHLAQPPWPERERLDPLVDRIDHRREHEPDRALAPGGGHDALPDRHSCPMTCWPLVPPSPAGRGWGRGSAPPARVDLSSAEHPHPTLPLKGEGRAFHQRPSLRAAHDFLPNSRLVIARGEARPVASPGLPTSSS